MKRINCISFASICLFIVFIFLSVFLITTDANNDIKTPSPFGIDFAVYYTAGQMVVSGDSNNIYNETVQHIELEKTLNRNIPFKLAWYYPPSFLLITVPLSFLPYYVSLFVWLTITFLLAIYSVSLLVDKNLKVIQIALGSPGILMNLRWGQNSFLSTAYLGFGFYFLESNPIISGLMFGLLTYKPQMALFPFLILFFSKKWRVLTWSCIFAFLTVIVSGILFGFDTWLNFIASFLKSSSSLLNDEWINISAVQPSIFSVLQLAGVKSNYINSILLFTGVFTTLTVVWIWKKAENMLLKFSALVIGIPLFLPYYVQYELMILVIPFTLLLYDFIKHGYKKFEAFILCLLWITPLLSWLIVLMTGIQINPFVLIAAMFLIIKRTKLNYKNIAR